MEHARDQARNQAQDHGPDRPVGGAALEPQAERVMQILGELAAELHPGLRRRLLTLDSSLGRDFGLDSLSRVEMLARLERAFQVRLDEDQALIAETPRDLLDALSKAGARPLGVQGAGVRPGGVRPGGGRPAGMPPPAAPLPSPAATGVPEQARTLIEALEWHVDQHADRIHLRLWSEGGLEDLTYGSLYEEAKTLAGRLRARGVAPGETVALMLPTQRAFFTTFYGTLLAGGIPVPLYPPTRREEIADHMRRQAAILNNAQAKLLITVEAAKRLDPLLRPLVPTLKAIATPEDLTHGVMEPPLLGSLPEATAMLQYTSGSTGQPKGVILTHRNLLANLRALGEAARIVPTDVFVSWLPLYHDMGLIGAWFGSLYFGIPGVMMSPLAFLARPERWLRTLHEQRGTLTAAPNFAYELCTRQIRDADLEGLDLSSLRLAVSGAEPVNPETLARFTARFAPYGLRPTALTPAYGLAESAVGVTLTPPGRGPRLDALQREPLLREGRAVPASADDATAIALVSCGKPLPGHQVRIVDDAGQPLPERQVGHVEFSGPSSTPGYFRNPEATRKLHHDGWLDTGDMGYLAESELYLSGRAKDMIIRGGQHLFPDPLEEAVSELNGIIPNGVAVFGSPDPARGTERLVVFAETSETRPEAMQALRQQIQDLSVRILDNAPDEILFGPPHSAPKTASGKIRRSTCRELYQRGELGIEKAFWRQIAGLTLEGAQPRLRRARAWLSQSLYAGYLWGLFGVVMLGGGGWMVISRSPTRNRRWVRRIARLLLRAAGISLRIEGQEHLQECRPCVIVANHASYLDALTLAAVLPETVTYTPKRDFTRYRSIRFFLERLGVRFVERQDVRAGIQDVEAVEAAVRQGESIAVFAEGGISRSAGLRPFHMGAFQVAAHVGAPILPVGIRGTREMMPADCWKPRRGSITLSIGEPLMPEGSDWGSALKLRDAAYRRVLSLSGEPPVES